MAADDDKRVCLGIITGVHGIKGEVVIKSFTADPLDIGAYGRLENEAGTGHFEIASARAGKKGIIARLRGIDSRNAAETLKGTALFVARARLPQPDDEDEFYYADLVGLAALDADGSPLGEVVGLHNFGAGDLIEIRLAGEKKTHLYPFTKAVVPTVSLADGTLTLVPPESIDDDDEPPTAED